MAVLAKDLAGDQEACVMTPVIGTSDATAYVAAWAAPFNIKLVSVHWRPLAAVTGADTTTRHLNLDNGGVDGDGSTELGNVDFVSGTDAAAGEAVEIYAPASPVAFAEGTLFKLESEEIGTGQGLPAGVLVFRFRGNGG